MKNSIYLIIVIIAVSYNNAETDTSSDDDFCNFGDFKIKLNEWAPAALGQCKKCKCNSVNPESLKCIPCARGRIKPEDKERCHFTEEDRSLQYPDCCSRVVCK